MQAAVVLPEVNRETTTPPAYAAFRACRYFRALDIFRFLSIVAVIWHHTEEGPSWFPASSRGFLGVDFFFVISGFLIVTLLIRERAKNGAISLRQFYLRRSLRIFPIYYALLGALAVFFLVIKPGSSMAPAFLKTLPYHALYLSNFIDTTGTILFFTWSLSTEEQFYVVWPPVERWFARFAVPLLLVVIVVNQMVNFGVFDRALGDYRSLFIAQITFTPICFGVLLAHGLDDPRWFARVSKVLGGWWVSLVLLVGLIGVCSLPVTSLTGWPRLLIQATMALLLTSCVIREDNALNRFLGFAWVRRIGVISYGMYLYHEFAAHAARVALGKMHLLSIPTAMFVLTLALTVAAAELSYRFYETPFLRLKDRLGRV